MTRPPRDIRTLAMHVVREKWRQPSGIAKWFTWYPPRLSYIEIGFTHGAAARRMPWTVASPGAPRWA